MVIGPWGEVLLDAGLEVGNYSVEIDLEAVRTARARIPSLTHGRDFGGPA